MMMLLSAFALLALALAAIGVFAMIFRAGYRNARGWPVVRNPALLLTRSNGNKLAE